MPDLDLDTELGRLRDGIRQSVPVPDFDRVLERSRQRVVRGRMQIAAAAAVLLVSVAVPLLRAGMAPDPVEPATPPAPATPSQQMMPTEPFIFDGNFADEDHGYAMRADCDEGPAPQDCAEILLATDDGGDRWTTRALPKPENLPNGALGRLWVLGEDEVAVDWNGSLAAQARRVHSTDGGQTWHPVEVPLVVTDTVPAIPDGGVLVVGCPKLVGVGWQCDETGVDVVLPGSGEPARLANPPRLDEPQPGPITTRDGRWWVVGRQPGTRQWAAAVSDDEGRTWVISPLGFAGTPAQEGWSVVSAGDTLYASAVGMQIADRYGMLAVLRSDDGGRSWERTWQWDEDAMPRDTLGQPVGLPDGSLMINAKGGKGRTFVSEDGGRTFTEVKRRYNGGAFWTRAGYAAWPADMPNDKFQFSADGEHWRDMTIK
ncbi:MAG: hypothetical protein GEV28_29730 [Actinophytocola sp.]|uniref:hypothetical protein n=1 Tax=Actinophytocola sp. TaxID=1872138 RepID=UPI0013282EC5|nr:hypothetical protein [Actinophytocola sp.]MPZ84350.1 hypothetical protein [Actinophytocola sp.]